MRKKRAYLLLEVLVAFAILSLCAIPLVSNPLELLHREIGDLEKMELSREAELIFAEVQAALIQNEIPWEQIGSATPQLLELPLAEKEVTLNIFKKKEFSKKISICTKREKKGNGNEIYRLLEVKILFPKAKLSHTYNLLAKKGGTHAQG